MAHHPAFMYHIHKGERFYLRAVGDDYECPYRPCGNRYSASSLRDGEAEKPITQQLTRYEPEHVEVLPPEPVQQRYTPSQYSGGGGGGGLLLLGLLFIGVLLLSRD